MQRRDESRAGNYRVGRAPTRLAPHNAETWERIAAELEARGSASYERLVALAKGHVSGQANAPHPHQFVDHCIRNGWLERIGE
jgi:hypothetical protein